MRSAIHEAEPCMGKERGQGIGLGAWQTWRRRRSILTRRGIYLGGRSTTVIRHDNEEATGIKDNGYSKKKIPFTKKESKKKRSSSSTNASRRFRVANVRFTRPPYPRTSRIQRHQRIRIGAHRLLKPR